MATLKSYVNGCSMGRGNNAPIGGMRGSVNGWSRSSVRRHKAWLFGVDVSQLDGSAFGVTLTMRDTPVEWQRRGTPHLHLAVYAPAVSPLGWWK